MKNRSILQTVTLVLSVLASTSAEHLSGHFLVQSPSEKALLRTRAPPLCPAIPLPTVAASELVDKLQPFLDETAVKITAALKDDNSPGGVVINVVYNDTVLWTRGFGLINDSDPAQGSPSGDTAFRIGSITKVFTALMMLMARDKGSLPSLDLDVTHFLPQLKIRNPFQTKRGITFRQLASHMAGTPLGTPCPNMFTTGCNLTYEKIYENLSRESLLFPPGSHPSYSNLGFAILGHTLAAIEVTSWEQLVQEMVLNPLNMTHTGNSFTQAVIKYMAVGYSPNGTVARLVNLGYESPAGQLYSTTNDLSQLIKMLFRPLMAADPDRGQLLDGETIREWMHPAFTYVDGSGYGYPWELVPSGNYTLRTKIGDVPGYSSMLQIAHEIKAGSVILQSCEGCKSFNSIVQSGHDIINKISEILWSMQQPPTLPPSPSDYVGVYTGQESDILQSVVKVTIGDISGHKVLMSVMLEEGSVNNLVMKWIDGDRFHLSLQGLTVPCASLSYGDSDELVEFQRRGVKVVSLTLPGLSYGVIFTKDG